MNIRELDALVTIETVVARAEAGGAIDGTILRAAWSFVTNHRLLTLVRARKTANPKWRRQATVTVGRLTRLAHRIEHLARLNNLQVSE